MTNMELRVRNLHGSLSNAEQKVADYFLANGDKIFSLPIAALAEQSGVSQVAWVRFCKTMGYSGFKEFKKELIAELNEGTAETGPEERYTFADVKDYIDTPHLIRTVAGSSVQALQETARLTQPDELEALAALLNGCSLVKLFGLGASALVAEDFQQKLLRIGKACCFSRDSLVQLTYAANCRPGEAAVFVSHSGETRELQEMLALAAGGGCETVAITRYGKSPLSAGARHHLYISSPEVYRRSGAMSSRLAQLMMVDMLFTAMCNRDYANIEQHLTRSYYTQLPHKAGK